MTTSSRTLFYSLLQFVSMAIPLLLEPTGGEKRQEEFTRSNVKLLSVKTKLLRDLRINPTLLVVRLFNFLWQG
jgi:hypothetical protein